MAAASGCGQGPTRARTRQGLEVMAGTCSSGSRNCCRASRARNSGKGPGWWQYSRSNVGQLWSKTGGWDHGAEQQAASGSEQGGLAVCPSGKGVLFCQHAILKETPCPSKAPQPGRCAGVQGRSTLFGGLMCPLKQTGCLP